MALPDYGVCHRDGLEIVQAPYYDYTRYLQYAALRTTDVGHEIPTAAVIPPNVDDRIETCSWGYDDIAYPTHRELVDNNGPEKWAIVELHQVYSLLYKSSGVYFPQFWFSVTILESLN